MQRKRTSGEDSLRKTHGRSGVNQDFSDIPEEIFRITFLICNESDGMNASDDKWTKIIDGMKIYNCDQLVSALKEAGFMEIKPYADAKKHWLCIVATK